MHTYGRTCFSSNNREKRTFVIHSLAISCRCSEVTCFSQARSDFPYLYLFCVIAGKGEPGASSAWTWLCYYEILLGFSVSWFYLLIDWRLVFLSSPPLFFFFPYVCVWEPARVQRVCRGQRITSSVGTCLLFVQTPDLLAYELLGTLCVPLISLKECWSSRCLCATAPRFTLFWRSGLRSSPLHNKHLTHWAIFLGPFLFNSSSFLFSWKFLFQILPKV